MAAEPVLMPGRTAAGLVTRNSDFNSRLSATLSMPRRAAVLAHRCLSHISAGQVTATVETSVLFTGTSTSSFPVRGPGLRGETSLLGGHPRPPSSEDSSVKLKACSAQGLSSPSASQTGGALLTRTASNLYTASQSRSHHCASDIHSQLSPAYSCRQLSRACSWRQLSPASQYNASTLSTAFGALQVELKPFASAATPHALPRVRPSLRQVSPPRDAAAARPWHQTRSAVSGTAAVEDTSAVAVNGAGAEAGTASAPVAEEAVPKPRRRRTAQEADPWGPLPVY